MVLSEIGDILQEDGQIRHLDVEKRTHHSTDGPGTTLIIDFFHE